MNTHVNRRTVDLSAYPDLVVVYFGMRVKALAGIFVLGAQNARAARRVASRT